MYMANMNANLLEAIHRDLLLLLNILKEEGELKEEVLVELEKARNTPESEFIPLEDLM